MKKSQQIPLALLMSLGVLSSGTENILFAEPLKVEYSLREESWKLIAGTVVPGTASRTLSYSTPGGTVYVTFSLGYDANGTITWVKATKTAGESTSGAYVSLFSMDISGVAVGKNVKSLSVGAVGGASLTSASFRQFLATVSPQAIPATTTTATPTKPTTTTTTTTKPTTTTTPTKPATTTTTTPSKPVTPPTPTNTEYRKTVRYTSPGGNPQVTFALTIAPDGKILKAGTIPVSGDQNSAHYAVKFIQDMQTIVGKNVKNLSVKAIGGASLTTKAFLQYLETYNGKRSLVTPPTGACTNGTFVFEEVNAKEKVKLSQVIEKTVEYNTPGGVSRFRVAFRIDASGKVKAINARGVTGSSKETLSFVKNFGRKIVPATLGKNISTLNLRSIGGASLTTTAFNRIITEARTASTSDTVNNPCVVKPVTKTSTGQTNTGTLTPLTEVITYATPLGTAQISFTLTKDATGIIKSVAASKVSGDATSVAFIQMFASSISSAAVGQNINTLSLNAVGGASLTTNAFNQFVSTLRTVQATVPGAPTGVTATAGDSQATISFSAPSNNGGATITGYRVTVSPGGAVVTGTSSPITVTGLSNNVNYSFSVVALNSAGASTASSTAYATPTAPKAPVGTVTSSTQTISYNTPGGNAQVSFTLAKDSQGIIQSVSASKVSGDSTSTAYISMFASSISSAAVGKNVDTLSLGAVGGASLTTNAFNQFVASLGAAQPVVTVPGAPTGVNATAGNAQAIVSFAAPSNNGGAAITQYQVTVSPGGRVVTGTSSPITVTGLTNGTAYTFSVKAVNSAGTSTTSASSTSVTPVTPPAPVGTNTTSTQTVTYNTPGTTAQISFTLTRDSQGVVQSVSASKVSADSTSTAYISMFASSISAVAVGQNINTLSLNAVGGASLTTNAFNQFVASLRTTQVAATVPGAPSSVAATAGDGQATVTFTPPTSNGGASITSYTVTASPGNITAVGTSSPITITGLSNGTTYTFTVKATNSVGSSSASAASSSITPVAPVVPASSSQVQQNITYGTPGGNATAAITLTYNSSTNIISAATATTVSANGDSAQFISKFNAGFGTAVIGQAVNTLPTLSRIGGASLTTNAFNTYAATLRGTTPASSGTSGGSSSSSSSSSSTSTTPQTYSVSVDSSGNFSNTSLTLKTGDSITFNYSSSTGEAVIQFSPSGTYSSFTLDKDITSRTITFTTTGTWTFKVKDKSGNTGTVTVQ